MLRLNLSAGPRWIDLLPGIRFQVLPVTTTVMMTARSSPRMADMTADTPRESVAMALALAVAEQVVIDWTGIVDDASGTSVPVSPPAIAAVLESFPVFEAFEAKVMVPAVTLESEGNGSGPSRTGTTAGAGNTALPVRSDAPSVPPG
jgi:hypothetical protein